MTWSRETTIWCDGCMDWEQRSGGKVAPVRKELKAKGWTTDKVDGEVKDFCPTCSKKRRET